MRTIQLTLNADGTIVDDEKSQNLLFSGENDAVEIGFGFENDYAYAEYAKWVEFKTAEGKYYAYYEKDAHGDSRPTDVIEAVTGETGAYKFRLGKELMKAGILEIIFNVGKDKINEKWNPLYIKVTKAASVEDLKNTQEYMETIAEARLMFKETEAKVEKTIEYLSKPTATAASTLANDEPKVEIDDANEKLAFKFTIPKGKDGNIGKDGVGIQEIVTTYQVGESGTHMPGGAWVSDITFVGSGDYLWTKTVVSFTDGSATEPSYNVSYRGSGGGDGPNFELTSDGTINNATRIAGISGRFKIAEFGILYAFDKLVNDTQPYYEGREWITLAACLEQLRELSAYFDLKDKFYSLADIPTCEAEDFGYNQMTVNMINTMVSGFMLVNLLEQQPHLLR